jgi:putative transcriptional regulator
MENAAGKFQGKLLLSSSKLVDPNFVRTVVLILQHNEAGALGLVLNRPSGTSMQEVCRRSLGEEFNVEGFVHQGGPCDGPLMVLHSDGFASDADVIPGVFVTTDKSKIESLLRQGSKARYFAGYSGWGAGQLESEMDVESWMVFDATPWHIFEGNQALWNKMMTQRILGMKVDPSRIPDDPSMN